MPGIKLSGPSPNRATRSFFNMVRTELRQRAEAVQTRVAERAAQACLETLRTRLAKQVGLLAEVRDSLRIEQVRVPEGIVFVVLADARGKRRPVEADEDLIYVHARKRRLVKTPAAIAVLARHSPWTADTLPFAPSAKDAEVTTRKVRKSEIVGVREARNKDRTVWSPELARAGVRVSRPKKSVAPVEGAPDLVFAALRAEYGKTPAWRPAVRGARAGALAGFHSPEIARALLHPARHQWRGWAPSYPEASPGVLKGVGEFQKLVGLG